MKTTHKGRRVLFGVCLLLLMAVFIELVLQGASRTNTTLERMLGKPWEVDSLAKVLPDEVLGFRPNPSFAEHDENGFRNPSLPLSAALVALGDSQTYGTGVSPEQTWPRQLESVTGKKIYSLAFGGYGPVHSLGLWDMGAKLKPRVVVEAFYSGNDLFDAYDIVYGRNQFTALRSRDGDVLDSISALNTAQPLSDQVERELGKWEEPKVAGTPSVWRERISTHSRIYGLLRRTRYELRAFLREQRDPWQRALELVSRNPQSFVVIDVAERQTVLTPAYRQNALDLDDPRIAEGLRICLESLRLLRDRSEEMGARFVVLLIPTKELVLEEFCREQSLGLSNEELVQLWSNERMMWEQAKVFLEDNEIDFADALPWLRLRLIQGQQPYQRNHDGHPNAVGYRAIAEGLKEYLKW